MENKHRKILMITGIVLLIVGSGMVAAVGVGAFLTGFLFKSQEA